MKEREVEEGTESGVYVVMASFLLEEKSKLAKKDGKSDYSAYLEMLPKDCKEFPIKFTNEELTYLKNTDV